MRRAAFILLTLTLAAFSLVRVPAKPSTIVIEAENHARILPPMRVARTDPDVSGGAHIELPLGSGQGWRGQGTGSVTYRVDLPSEGAYGVWARTLWGDGCTNAFFLTANDGPRVVFGNDAIFGQWHWVKGQTMHLQKGVNYLTFSNHSDGTALDKLILTSNPLYYPEGLGQDITHFFDGFAGCDADNTGSWQFVSGRWRIVRAVEGAATSVSDCLAQWDPDGGLALGGFPVWHDYDASVRVMLTEPGTVGLVFYSSGPDYALRLLWRVGSNGSELCLERQTGGDVETLARSAPLECHLDHWYELGFVCHDSEITCMLDGHPVIQAEVHGERLGQIGLLTEQSMGVYFDNVQVQFS